MIIQTATINDIPSILKIIADARELIQSHHFNQWAKETNYPNADCFKADILNKALYVAKVNNEVVGVMALYCGADENYETIDGKWLSNQESYATIHRLAIKKEFYHMGIATALINFAINSLKHQVSYLRIDTHKKNIMMNSLAKKMGFSYCGIIKILRDSSDNERNAYERMI